MVTFNKTLLNYIKYQYKKVEDDGNYQFEMLFNKDKEVVINTIDSLMHKYFLKYVNDNQKELKLITDYSLEVKSMSFALNDISKNYPNIKILTPKNIAFLRDEITWIKACNITSLEDYQNIDRIGRSNGASGAPQKLLKNSEVREFIYELMYIYDSLLEQRGYVDFKKMKT